MYINFAAVALLICAGVQALPVASSSTNIVSRDAGDIVETVAEGLGGKGTLAGSIVGQVADGLKAGKGGAAKGAAAKGAAAGGATAKAAGAGGAKKAAAKNDD